MDEKMQTAFQPIDESQINWKQGESLGINRQTLEEAGQLKAMLYGHKSPALNHLSFIIEGVNPDKAQTQSDEKQQKKVNKKKGIKV